MLSSHLHHVGLKLHSPVLNETDPPIPANLQVFILQIIDLLCIELVGVEHGGCRLPMIKIAKGLILEFQGQKDPEHIHECLFHITGPDQRP